MIALQQVILNTKLGASTLFGVTTLFGVVSADAIQSSFLDENTHVPLAMVAGVVCFACTGAWWLAKKLQRIEDKLEQIEANCNSVACIANRIEANKEQNEHSKRSH
jgi:hypothetical protein